MTIKDHKSIFIEGLKNIYPQQEIESFYKILLRKIGKSQIDVALNPDIVLNHEELLYFNDALFQLKKEIPVQYIIGETHFFDLKFIVNKNVLIPRPETEELVLWILEGQKNNLKDAIKILDIGTGSGCIAITLAKNLPNAQVFAIDISTEALKIAQANTQLNDVSIQFQKLNILEIDDLSQQYDIIVSNPPYVRQLEKLHMQKNVLENEPQIALFVDDENPLLFYNKITSLAKNYLTKNGQLYFEINQYLGAEMLNLLKKYDFQKIEIKKDFYEAERMIRGTI